MMNAALDSVEQINDTTYTFWFKPDHTLDYTAGQFVELFIPHQADNRGSRRWFTLSSSPTEKMIAITTRKSAKPSSFKKLLFNLTPGDNIQVTQAMGDFVLPMQKSIPIIYLIRGIGVTPVRSMLTSLHDSKEKRDISVIASIRQDDAMFSELLESVNHYETCILSSNSEAHEPTQKAIDLIKRVPNSRIYVSGPEQFVELAYKQLRDEGVNNTSIVTDYFHGYEA